MSKTAFPPLAVAPPTPIKQPAEHPPGPQNIRLRAEIMEVDTEVQPDGPGGITTKPTIEQTYAGEITVIFDVAGKEQSGIPFTCETLSEESCALLLAAFIQRGK